MKKFISFMMQSILCLLSFDIAFASSASATQITDQSSDTIFRSQIVNTLNQLRRNQNKIHQDYKSLYSYLKNRDSIIISSLDNSNNRTSNIEDSLAVLNSYIQNELIATNRNQTELHRQTNIYVVLLATLIFGVLVLLIYMIRKTHQTVSSISILMGRKESEHEVSKTSMSQCDKRLEALQSSLVEILSKIKTISVDQGNIKETSSSNFQKINQLVESLNEILSNIGSLSTVSAVSPSTVNMNKPDKVAYDAAVDAWRNINDHLASLGKDRWKIQHVYALLAGETVEDTELRTDLGALNDERKEEVNVIISDIRRFMSQHLNAIESWISFDAGSTKTLKDVVRFPLGKSFNKDLDEELTGETVNDGETISMVASLGYLFPGSRNGCYREKSKVKVQK